MDNHLVLAGIEDGKQWISFPGNWCEIGEDPATGEKRLRVAFPHAAATHMVSQQLEELSGIDPEDAGVRVGR